MRYWDADSASGALPPPPPQEAEAAPPRNPLARKPIVPSPGTSLKLVLILGAATVLASSTLFLRQAVSVQNLGESDLGHADARLGLLALRLAYPERISALKRDFDTGEWVIELDGVWYCWAGGRILPLAERADQALYRPFIETNYPWKVIDPEALDKATIEKLKRFPQEQKLRPPTHPGFATALYGGSTEGQLWDRQRRIRFLGRWINAHAMIVGPLAEVERDIMALAPSSPEIQAFLKQIDYIGAFNYRRIRGQTELSRHSYGVAVDILPKGRAARTTYWQWIMEEDPEWPIYPLEERWMPPDQVVRIFEEHGFIWGGKWLEYDTMHFEYRPEQLILRAWYRPWYLCGGHP